MRTFAFDELAAGYDGTFTHTAVGRALRQLVWERFEPVFGASHRIIELGCGTGEDAVRLARRGRQVVATDVSAAMIGMARLKVAQRRSEEFVDLRCVPMEELASALGNERFDGALSNFGAVNCATHVPSLVAAMAQLLQPAAPLLWVVMGRRVPWEWGWYLWHGELRRASRRMRPGGVQWRGINVTYPTPRQLTRLLNPYFAIRRIAPLGVVLPPSYAAAWLDRAPRALALLMRGEKFAQRLRWLAAWSDHFIIEAVRRPVGDLT